MTNSNKRNNVQILRGVAILMVIAFHVRESLFPSGFVGVEIFFVISGFVLSPSLTGIARAKDRRDARALLVEFLKRRANRLLPAFYFLLISSSALLLVLSSIVDHKRIALQGLFSIFSIGNIGANLFSGDYFNPNPNPYIHLWSLSAEEQIYLIAATAALFVSVIRSYISKKLNYLIIIGLIVTMSIPVLGSLFFQDSRLEGVLTNYYSPFSKIWLFVFGLYLNKLFSNRDFNLSLSGVRLVGLSTLMMFSLVLLLLPTYKDSTSELVLATVFATTFIALPENVFLKKKYFNIFGWLGDRSYSIYLFHMPLIYLAKYSPLSGVTSMMRLFFLAWAILLTFILGNLSYRFVESPRNFHLRSNIFASRKYVSLVISILLLVAMYFGSSLDYGLRLTSLSKASNKSFQHLCPVSSFSATCFNKFRQENETLLLLGDSHARHLLPPLVKIAKTKNLNIVYVPLNILNKGGWSKLDSEERNLLLRVARITDSRYLLMSELFTSSVENENLEDFLGPLEGRFRQTILAGQTPKFLDTNALIHFFQPSLISAPFVKEPTTEVVVLETDQSVISSGVRLKALAKKNRIFFLNTSVPLCPNEICIRKIRDSWLYVDDHHLSAEGANLLSPHIEAAFNSSQVESGN